MHEVKHCREWATFSEGYYRCDECLWWLSNHFWEGAVSMKIVC